SEQAEVCAGVLGDVIRCVLSGSDGCVLALGCADVACMYVRVCCGSSSGSWSSMVGSGESVQKLGLIPCAISWLYAAIERRREKTWTDLSVSVSAVELCCGEEDTLRDLLGEVAPRWAASMTTQRLTSESKRTLFMGFRAGKLGMLLRDSLGHINCHTTVMAEVSDSLAHLQETLSTLQMASRIRRTQRRTKQSTSCSPSTRSLTKDYKRGLLSLRAFHSTEEVDAVMPHFSLRSDERSSSDQSCDTVIQLDSEGLVQSRATSRLAQPEFVPIIPSLHPNKADMEDPEMRLERRALKLLTGSKQTKEPHQLDALTNRPREVLEEMKATITVTVQQPLDLKGQDELVFSMVEEVTISGALKRGRAGGNVICIRDGVQSLEHVQGSGSSQPIRIISNVGDDAVPAGWSDSAKRCTVQAQAPETKAQPQHPPRKEKRYLPSFINPMLMNTDVEVELEEPEEEASFPDSLPPQTGLGGIHVNSREDRKVPEERIGRAEKPEVPESSLSQTSHDSVTLGDLRCRDKSAEKACGKRPRGTDRGHPGERGPAFPSTPPRISEEAEIWSRRGRSDPRGTGLPPGCQETSYASIRTGSLPRLWHKANHRDTSRGGYTADAHRDLRGVTSSTPCSPDVTLKRRQRMQHAAANHSVLVSKQHVNGKLSRQSVETLCQSSSLRGAKVSGRLKSPTEDRLFNVRLEQPATRSNSLGRTPRDFPTLGRDSSSTSMSSKGSSKESTEGAFSRGFKGLKEGDYTSPRATRSPRKNRSEQSYHFFPFDEAVAQPASRAHPKLSAVGKLKMACGPKVRRLSAPSFRSLSLTRKSLQPVDRSESPSPDSKCVSFERTSSFLSSSPPRSFRSISRTPSQSSTCSSTKSAIQGFVNGRISDLLKERPVSPVSAGLDPMGALPSPYSRVTSPRVPDRSSGHASDTTSVLSGDLPPAMGKTSLYFSGRSSMVSSGYDSMVKDGEVGGSGTSACYSSSDRSGSLLSVARSSRSSRRRGHTGKTPGRNGLL
ncbi:unnamed protein product, partial [Tetraodon nigroviridis]